MSDRFGGPCLFSQQELIFPCRCSIINPDYKVVKQEESLMNEYRKRLMPNVYLTVLPARKFKTGCLSAQFTTALDPGTGVL